MTKIPTEKSESKPAAKAAPTKAASGMASRRGKSGSNRFSTWLRSIWRQRWLSLVTAWAFCMIGWAAVALWPNNYLSSAVIYADVERLIDEGHEPEDLEGANGADQGPETLLKSTLLRQENLDDILSALKLDDQRARSLGDDIMIRATAPPLFVAAYHHEDPTIAQRVLTTLFSSFRAQLGETAVEQVASLDREIADAEDRFEIAEAEFSAFKQANIDVLDEAAKPSGNINDVRDEIADLEARIERAIAERDEVAQALAELPRSGQEQIEEIAAEKAKAEKSLEDELVALQKKLGELRERYADSHPYVLAVVEAINAVESQEDDASNDTVAAGSGDLAAKLADLKQRHDEKSAAVAELNNELANKQREIDRLNALTETTPSVEADHSELETRKDDLEATLADLVTQRDDLRQETDGQVRQQEAASGQQAPGQQQAPLGQQETNVEQASFRLINEPNLPSKPTGPSRLLCLALVLLGGIGLGGSIAVFRNNYQGVFESAWQLKQRFDVGVLGTVSEVLSPAERKQLGFSRLAFGLGCLGLVGVFSGLAIAEFLNVLTPWGDRLRTQLLG